MFGITARLQLATMLASHHYACALVISSADSSQIINPDRIPDARMSGICNRLDYQLKKYLHSKPEPCYSGKLKSISLSSLKIFQPT